MNFFFLYFGRKYVKERALLRRAFYHFIRILHFFDERAKFEPLVNFLQTLLVGFFHLEAFRVEVDRNICPDGHQKFRETDFLNILFNFLFQCSFQLSGVCDERFHVAKICQKRFCRFFAHAGTARNIVGGIARKA